MAMNGEQLTPKVRRSILQSRMTPWLSLIKNLWRSQHSGLRRISLNILDLQWQRNLMRTSVRGGYRLGPVRRVSLREAPEVVTADASNTALHLVVDDESLKTPWTGK